ncbi:KH domain-containing protein [Dactylosporangium sp. NBC_01737]|uniref:KH domain-containing protein n=1 Tax=Dactylosporangium sp. NBC_01737 TaxID=2975959 RepID=UPI002E14520F|nr:KH domain-containing protein [Dactylosporangium sp. NBC_01737]
MTTVVAPVADMQILLDVREWPDGLHDAGRIADLWNMLEPVLHGHDLTRRPRYTLGHPNGDVHIALARLAPGADPVVGPSTTFQIVGMLEPAKVRYRCQGCAAEGRERYGSFTCRDCGTDALDKRLCDVHARILDGALISTCAAHEPTCAECGATATFRCAGGRCQRQKAHCDRHRRTHPSGSDRSYCPSCYDAQFPACEQGGCTNMGTARCEVTEVGLRQCGVRMCAQHLRRWQVFGGEGLGLALCRRHHRELPGYSPPVLIRQIVAGAYLRSRRRRDAEPLPSLRGFGHSLRRAGHTELALDFRWILRTIDAAQHDLTGTGGRDSEGVLALVQRRHGRWDDEIKKIAAGNDRGAELVERLKILVRHAIPVHGDVIAANLSLADYNRPRAHRDGDRPGLLFVRVPEAYRGIFIGRQGALIRYFSEQLSQGEQGGVRVQIEGDKRGSR